MSAPIAMTTRSYQTAATPASNTAEGQIRARERCSKIYRITGGIFIAIGVAAMTVVPSIAKSYYGDDGLVKVGMPAMVLGFIIAGFGGWVAISECQCQESSERDMFVV